MGSLEKKYILSLSSSLDSLSSSSDVYDLLKILISWLSSDQAIIDGFKNLGYDFSPYLNMNADDYPVEKSLLNEEEIVYFKNNIHRKIASGYFKFQYFVQYIRDTLEHIFIEHVEKNVRVVVGRKCRN